MQVQKTIKINLLNIIIYIVAVLIISSGVFFALESILGISSWVSLVFSYAIGAGILIASAVLYSNLLKRRKNNLTRRILKLGSGQFDISESFEIDEILNDINKSIEIADKRLASRLKSVQSNAKRLSYIEEQLSSRFRTDRRSDKNTRDLVCQLKICTSRLKNELTQFTTNDIIQ